jgi:endogenous inhibitor of DNA gyrase (YacG/DUF329 family)
MAEPDNRLLLKRRCPICGKPQQEKTAPFCSKRCADIDLSRWLKGVYAIPVEEPDESETPERDDDKEK